MKQLPDLLALAGTGGAGKSTIARELVDHHGYTLVKFAAPLKAMLTSLGLNDTEIEGALKERPCDLLCGQTPRHAMQSLGTEWGRVLIGERLWVNAWARRTADILAAGGRVLVDDCRFANELHAVLQMGGVAIRLVRDAAGIAGAHVSESGLASVVLPEIANDADPARVAARLAAFISREP